MSGDVGAEVAAVVLSRAELDLMREAAEKDAADPLGNDGVAMVKVVQSLIAERVAAAVGKVEQDWLRRYSEAHQQWMIDAHPWCTCEEGPYFGAQLIGAPLRCERCGHDESEPTRAAKAEALREVETAVLNLCNAATTSANEFGSRTFVLDVDEFRAALDPEEG